MCGGSLDIYTAGRDREEWLLKSQVRLKPWSEAGWRKRWETRAAGRMTRSVGNRKWLGWRLA